MEVGTRARAEDGARECRRHDVVLTRRAIFQTWTGCRSAANGLVPLMLGGDEAKSRGILLLCV